MPTSTAWQSSHPARTRRRGVGVAVAAATAATAGLFAAATAATAGLFAAAPAAASSGLLQAGGAGAPVSQIQHALHLRATGRFGPGTLRAVRAFQRRDGLTVDGIVGPQTWDALFGIEPPAGGSGSGGSGASAVSAGGSAVSGTTSTGGYTIPSSIVHCESGGDYSAVNPSTGAGGAYQILPSTWQAYGGQGLPQDASPAEQNRIAEEIYAQQGASAWSC